MIESYKCADGTLSYGYRKDRWIKWYSVYLYDNKYEYLVAKVRNITLAKIIFNSLVDAEIETTDPR